MSQKLLVVVGATGSQGQAVINHFLKTKAAYRIRGLTRNPTSFAAKSLTERGVEVIGADLDDLSSLKQVFEGANAIFAYTATDILVTTSEAVSSLESGRAASIGEAAYPIEIRQGRNIADAAASIPSLEQLVWSSLSDVRTLSGGRYQNAWHENAKAEVAEYMRSLPALQGKVNTVIMGAFVGNAVRAPELFSPQKQDDGTFVLALPSKGEQPLPFIDVANDTGAIVYALLKAPGGTNVIGASEYLSFRDWLQLWASHVGVKTRYEYIPLEEFCRDDPDGGKREIAETLHFFEEFGYTGSNPDVMSPDEFESQTGILIARTKIIDSIRRHDWSFVL